MKTKQTDWARPPVIEVVIAIQFEPLERFNNGHLGWFWNEIKENYPNATDSGPIQTILDSFGDEPEFRVPGFGIVPTRGDSRLRMTSTGDGSRMIQVQNGWFVVNWTKRGESPYPGFTGVLDEFESTFHTLKRFVAAEGLGVLKPNLWEVTYIDHIPRGSVWHRHSDVPRVVRGLLGDCVTPSGSFEAITAGYSIRLQPEPGRLNITLQTARSATVPTMDLLVMTSTARGPITTPDHESLVNSLKYGQSAVVDTFMTVTSDDAKAYWKG